MPSLGSRSARGLLPGLLLALWAAAACAAPSHTATAVRVLDGDSLILRLDGRERECRLDGIDAPERHQPYADVARRTLRELVLGQPLTVRALDVDRYDRLLVRVSVDGLDVNRELIRRGLAWHATRHSARLDLAAAEQEARAARRGLWQEDDPVPPWQFRDRARRQRPARGNGLPATAGGG